MHKIVTHGNTRGKALDGVLYSTSDAPWKQSYVCHEGLFVQMLKSNSTISMLSRTAPNAPRIMVGSIGKSFYTPRIMIGEAFLHSSNPRHLILNVSS